MKKYLVGGHVRDKLLGITPGDRDYVVVGATDEVMKKKGFIRVGKSFPVYLHPDSKEEYALARKETKTSEGHTGFSFNTDPSITLHEDLFRRDFTINSIALDEENGEYVDPYGGMKDLQNKVLRHISSHFQEDPLRILRGARFLSFFTEFSLAPETLLEMKKISASGELKTLSSERIFIELRRALEGHAPWRFIETLDECGALKQIFPEIANLKEVPQKAKYHPEGDAYTHTILALKAISKTSQDAPTRFAVLFHDIGKGTTPKELLPSHKGHEERGHELFQELKNRMNLPKEYERIAIPVIRYHLAVHKILKKTAAEILCVIKNLQLFRDKKLFENILVACEADDLGKNSYNYPSKIFLLKLANHLLEIDFSEIKKNFQGKMISEKMDEIYILEIDKFKESFLNATLS